MIIGIPQPSNIMQRVFDVLKRAGPVSVDELCRLMPFDMDTILAAMNRLRKAKKTRTECRDGVWFYAVRDGAERPGGERDGRGPKKRAA